MDHSERLINSTIRIEADFGEKGIVTGTGFIFNFELVNEKSKKIQIPVIVTNKHVVVDSKTLTFFCNGKTSQGLPDYSDTFEIVLDSKIYGLINEHPDSEIDLAVIPIKFLSNSADDSGNSIYYDKYGEAAIPSQEIIDDLLAIEEIHMIGYPNGLWDQTNNLPIVRKGITATNPVIDYEGKKEFLIDIAAFPGSSGSPVFIYNSGPYQTKKSIKLGGRIYLLGILYAGPMFEIEGEVIIDTEPDENKPETISQIPMNLGIVIKTEKLYEFRSILQKLHNGLTK